MAGMVRIRTGETPIGMMQPAPRNSVLTIADAAALVAARAAPQANACRSQRAEARR
jgi:hypothetical protein